MAVTNAKVFFHRGERIGKSDLACVMTAQVEPDVYIYNKKQEIRHLTTSTPYVRLVCQTD